MNTAEIINFPGADAGVQEHRVADTDDGYTRLANELLEELIGANLTKNQAKVAFAVCRKTYGFNKKTDRIADTQLTTLTKLPRQKVNAAKNELLAMRVLIAEGNQIGLNKNLNEWVIPDVKKGPNCHHGGDCHHNDDTVTTVVTKSVTRTVTGVSPAWGHTKDTITKDKKDIISSSRNSDESPDDPTEKFLSRHPEAAGGIYTPAGKSWGTSEDLRAAHWIYAQLLVVNASLSEPNWVEWANTIRLMRLQDNRTHYEICELLRWASKDDFWKDNILSPSSLRKQWDRLTTRRQSEHSGSKSTGQPIDWNNTDWIDGVLDENSF
ncbi:replication protein [Trabulsiella odontotermitis]|uniref:replication protein n=1 Tax=Trabulsiella odontotermitis TaxID=379893 RepID=UPI003AC23CAF